MCVCPSHKHMYILHKHMRIDFGRRGVQRHATRRSVLPSFFPSFLPSFYLLLCTYIHTCVYMYMCIYIHTYIFICSYITMHTCIHARARVDTWDLDENAANFLFPMQFFLNVAACVRFLPSFLILLPSTLPFLPSFLPFFLPS